MYTCKAILNSISYIRKTKVEINEFSFTHTTLTTAKSSHFW